MDKVVNNLINIEPGETELDYVNPDELQPKKKKVVKKDNKPIVKTKNKSKK